jgi:N-glycosylase/DNA lyase
MSVLQRYSMRELRVNDFSLQDTIECGQTFCWTRLDDGYVNAEVGLAVYVEQEGNKLRYESSGGRVDLRDLIRLDDPVKDIKQEICRDGLLEEAIAFAPGLRIVSDGLYPCLVSFLCSVWKNIPAIEKLIQGLRENYGPSYMIRGHEVRGLPTPEQLAGATELDLRALGMGWRAAFIVKSTEAILAGDLEEESLQQMSYQEAHAALKELHGVGDKVADCVCLFSLGFLEAFPIDVWIERAIQDHYDVFTQSGKSYKAKAQAARAYFGQYAGYAQEYIYHYLRNCR